MIRSHNIPFLSILFNILWIVYAPVFSQVDTFPPEVTVNIPGATYNEILQIKFELSEQGKVYYSITGEEPTLASPVFSGLLTIAKNGKTVLKYFAMDLVGNSSSIDSQIYYVQLNKAPLELAVDMAPGSYNHEFWLHAITNRSADIYYTIDGSIPVPESNIFKDSLKISESCEIKMLAMELSGTKSVILNLSYKIQKKELSVECTPLGGYFPKPTAITLHSPEAVKLYYSKNPSDLASAFTIYETPVILPEGKHFFRYYARDEYGNISTMGKQNFIIDMTRPELNSTIREENDSIFIKLKSNEKSRIYYALDGSFPAENSRQFLDIIALPKTGAIKLRAIAIDLAGNKSLHYSKSFIYDSRPPVLSAEPPDGIYNKSITVIVKADEESKIYFTMDGSKPTIKSDLYIKPILINKSWNGVFRFIGIDIAGNTSEVIYKKYNVDLITPKIKVTIESDTTGKWHKISLTPDEKCDVYYTVDKTDPSPASLKYTKPIRAKAGTAIKYLGIDKAGNHTKIFTIDKIETPTLGIKPPGGIHNQRIDVSLSMYSGEPIFFRVFTDRSNKGDYQLYKEPIPLYYNGLYSIEYYIETRSGEKSVIKEEKYLMDFLSPQVKAFTKRGKAPGTVKVIFSSMENISTFYTLDRSDPLTSNNKRVIGNKFISKTDSIEIKREEDLVLTYIAEDMAGNYSEKGQINLSLPTVIPSMLAGQYNTILHLELETYNNAVIHYTTDGSVPTEHSSVYKAPLIIGTDTEVRYFAIDDLGYRSPVYLSKYVIDLPPRADFSVNTKDIYVDREIIFDPKYSIDEETPSDKLTFRWDFNNGQKFETDFENYRKMTHTFNTPGKHNVTLQVRDNSNLIGTVSKTILVKKSCPLNMVSIIHDTLSYCMDIYEFPNRQGEKPRTNISWVEAFMHCRDINKRLCSLDEWNLACSGINKISYPYGNQYHSKSCNSASGKISKSGRNNKCKSEFGVYDLAGNIWEWVADREQNTNIIAGGSFQDGFDSGCFTSFYNNLARKSANVGFRCCK
ncbi:MAG: chitobiase/beta-hexosaminidase C-terminal domain-containing protein [bacterium]